MQKQLQGKHPLGMSLFGPHGVFILESIMTEPQTSNPPTTTFRLDFDIKQRIAKIFTPSGSAKVTVAWNFVRKDGKIQESEKRDAWTRYLSDLPYAPITSEIEAAIEAARKVSRFLCHHDDDRTLTKCCCRIHSYLKKKCRTWWNGGSCRKHRDWN